MASLEVNAHYENAFSTPAATPTVTNGLTCPDGHRYILDRINVCASDGVAGTIDITHYVASTATTYTLKKAAVVPAADSYTWIDIGTTMFKGDIIKLTPSRANQHVRFFYMNLRMSSPLAARLP